MTAFGVCGANTAAPSDTNPGLPKATAGFWGISHSNTVSTSNANDFIFDFDASQGNPGYTPLNGYTSVLAQQVPSWMANSVEYKVLSAQQSASTLGFTLTVGQSGSQMVDAIVAASTASSLLPGLACFHRIPFSTTSTGGACFSRERARRSIHPPSSDVSRRLTGSSAQKACSLDGHAIISRIRRATGLGTII